MTPKKAIELFAQHRRSLETAIFVKVVAKEAIHGTGNVAPDRIERFIFAAKPIRAPRIDQQ